MSESMPCPRCGITHARGDYVHRPELATKPLGVVMAVISKKHGKGVRLGTPLAPPDVECQCVAILRHTVPIFATDPYGRHWRII